jgi:hypothetical protein
VSRISKTDKHCPIISGLDGLSPMDPANGRSLNRAPSERQAERNANANRKTTRHRLRTSRANMELSEFTNCCAANRAERHTASLLELGYPPCAAIVALSFFIACSTKPALSSPNTPITG